MVIPRRRVLLIVEDEALIRLAAVDVMTDAGFFVIDAENAAEAISVATDYPDIDLLFTDVNMAGDMNGIALAEHLFAHRPRLKIIVTSAIPLSRPIGHLSAQFLEKPYLLDELYEVASGLLAA
jgi:DNA-binding NtrC family response regulator